MKCEALKAELEALKNQHPIIKPEVALMDSDEMENQSLHAPDGLDSKSLSKLLKEYGIDTTPSTVTRWTHGQGIGGKNAQKVLASWEFNTTEKLWFRKG